MRVESLREQVLEANLELVRRELVVYTFGNASGISRQEGVIAIKPSGVPYEQLTPDLAGNVVEGNLRPSSDLPTHVELYRQCPTIGEVAHTHSEFATAWAQAQHSIPCFGTTHADYFKGPVPVTNPLPMMKSRTTTKEIPGSQSVESSTKQTRWLVRRPWWPAMHRSAGARMWRKLRTTQ